MKRYSAASIAVFAGPSLAGWQPTPPFVRHSPAAAGDLLRMLDGPPVTSVLIDGVFGSRRSVWHKEILVLLAAGHRVVGAASMGALRAAELAPLGMIGSGSIFVAYYTGRIVADDEVAVVHAPPEVGATPLSVAQVDVRAVLAAALRARVLDLATARSVRAESARIFYADRTWPLVLDHARMAGLDVASFAEWLLTGEFSQKHRDAMAALALASSLAPAAPRSTPGAPPRTPFLLRLAETVGDVLPLIG